MLTSPISLALQKQVRLERWGLLQVTPHHSKLVWCRT